MKDEQIALGDGRSLAYTDIGDPDGPCLLFFHGAPTCRLELVGLDTEFARLGVRVVSPDRPGYGRSSPQPGRSMADWPADVDVLATLLGIDRFFVAGYSSGGPYAVACAALLRARVLAGVVVSGVTDMAWPAAWDGFPDFEAQIMRLPGEDAAIAWCTERFGADGSGFLDEPFQLCAPDAALLADHGFSSALRANVVEAFRQGVVGYAQDAWVQGRAWPFDGRRISVPMAIVHGDLDTFLPVAHSRHTAASIPGATFRLMPGHGHLTILPELPALAAALVGSAGPTSAA